jgi:hypothetical protein
MNTALFLEICAQAMRDPQIAEAMRGYDETVFSELGDWLKRDLADGGYGLPDAIVPSRTFMLASLIEGLKLRVARSPELDLSKVHDTLGQLLDLLLSPPD